MALTPEEVSAAVPDLAVGVEPGRVEGDLEEVDLKENFVLSFCEK
jgi:hypothetical protein